MKRLLIVDDDETMCAMLATTLGKRGFAVVTHSDAARAFEELRSDTFDAVLTDLNMHGMNGLALCERIVADRPDVPVIVITAFGSLDTAIAAIRVGAYDFLPKPFEIDTLVVALERAIQHRVLRQEVVRLRQVVSEARRLEEFIGNSEAMKAVYDLTARIGASDAAVLLTGENSTGKELVARALHRSSRRKDMPFVALNCAAVPDSLLETELFGHAGSGNPEHIAARQGVFLRADGGTLFLNEVEKLPLTLQPTLLRAIQERKVRPVLGEREIPFNVRLITATNVDLETSVTERCFREDLYYCINVLHIAMPPLRARGNDILLLSQHFAERFAKAANKEVRGISAPAAEKLLAYTWPGNVRELYNCIERAVALAQYNLLSVEDLPEKVRDYKQSRFVIAGDDPADLVSMDVVERRYILRVLEAVRGNKTVAARILGFDRTTLYRKLERYGLDQATPE